MDLEREAIARVFTSSSEAATRVVELSKVAGLELAVHVCASGLADAVATAQAAEVRLPFIAVVEGRNDAAAALGAGIDEAIEERLLSPELLAMAVRLASERVRHRRDREVLERSLAHREQLAALGTVVAGVAHEIANPAAVLGLCLEGLGVTISAARARLRSIQGELQGSPALDSLSAALALLDERHSDAPIADALMSVRMIRDIVVDLRAISQGRADDAPPEVVDLGKLVAQASRLAAIDTHTIHVELDFPEEVPLLWLPRSRLMQIVTNLITNAKHAMAAIVRPLHRLRVTIREDETALMLAVSDTGCGIPAALLDRMFTPFFTTKGPEHGTGLGLFLSREIVRKLGGDLTLDSVEGEGTTTLMFLPLALRTTALAERSAPSPHRPRVMLVDTDLERLRSAEGQLRRHYDVLIARGVVEAIDLLESGARVDAILSELDMPGMDGFALLECIRSRWPALVERMVLFGSDRSDPPVHLGARVVYAPKEGREVLPAVRDILR